MPKSSANSSDVGIKKDDRLLAYNAAAVSEVRRVDCGLILCYQESVEHRLYGV